MDETLSAVAAAYQGVDDLATLTDPAALSAYRADLLQRSEAQAALLAPLLGPGTRALEVGCGNGRLLVALTRDGGPVTDGHGIDIAASRIAFAQAWADALELHGLRFSAADALTVDLPDSGHDAVLLLTGALGYFGAARPRRDRELLERLARTTAPGGLLALELYPHPRERALAAAAGGRVRLWHELPDDDPWRFYLSDLQLDDGVLGHAKTFVHRHDGRIDEGRSERLHLYSAEEATAMVEAAGFEAVDCRDGWTDAPYDGGDVLVVLARRAS